MYWVVIVLRILHMFNSILLRNKKKSWEMGERKGRWDVKVGLTFAFFIRN
jgi:hypothetical protein